MYRACSTWQYTVAAHLIERYRGGERLGYLSGVDYANLPTPKANDRQQREATSSTWRVFKSHDGDRFFARALAKRQALVLYAYRDVRDVTFSLMHKRGLDFDAILKQGMIHQILHNDRFWTRRGGVLIQRYEDLTSAPATGVIQIARHLGIEIDDVEASRIAQEYSVESNRARIESLQQTLRTSGVDLNDSSNQQICDSATLLHWNHLRPTSTQTWRELATSSQRAILDRCFGRWLRDHGYARDEEVARDRSIGLSRKTREQLTLWRGWSSCRLHNLTLDYPKVARKVKRLVGLERPDATASGAVNWQDVARDRKSPAASVSSRR